jgi:hypothetical protein
MCLLSGTGCPSIKLHLVPTVNVVPARTGDLEQPLRSPLFSELFAAPTFRVQVAHLGALAAN